MESTIKDAVRRAQKKLFMAYPSICLEELRKAVKMYQVDRRRIKRRIPNKGKMPKCSTRDV
jgi:hypothetical protein